MRTRASNLIRLMCSLKLFLENWLISGFCQQWSEMLKGVPGRNPGIKQVIVGSPYEPLV